MTTEETMQTNISLLSTTPHVVEQFQVPNNSSPSNVSRIHNNQNPFLLDSQHEDISRENIVLHTQTHSVGSQPTFKFDPEGDSGPFIDISLPENAVFCFGSERGEKENGGKSGVQQGSVQKRKLRAPRGKLVSEGQNTSPVPGNWTTLPSVSVVPMTGTTASPNTKRPKRKKDQAFSSVDHEDACGYNEPDTNIDGSLLNTNQTSPPPVVPKQSPQLPQPQSTPQHHGHQHHHGHPPHPHAHPQSHPHPHPQSLHMSNHSHANTGSFTTQKQRAASNPGNFSLFPNVKQGLKGMRSMKDPTQMTRMKKKIQEVTMVNNQARDSLRMVRRKNKLASKWDLWEEKERQERESIKEFWISLTDNQRRELVKLEKEAVLKKMKEQQKHTCSCSVCGRRRTVIEEELEMLYDAYYEELEHYDGDKQKTPSEDNEGFSFARSLTVKGGILTVADDLLKNEGKKFLEMMENVAERRMRREEGSEEYDDTDEEYECDDGEDGEEADAGEEEEVSNQHRLEEGRRMFQMFAAKMFEQRVLSAYREKVAYENQKRLIEEEEAAERQKQAQLESKVRKAKLKKEKKKQAKLALEEKKKKEEEEKEKERQEQLKEQQRLEQELAKEKQEKLKQEEQRKKQEERRQQKMAEKKKQEEKKKEEQRKKQEEQKLEQKNQQVQQSQEQDNVQVEAKKKKNKKKNKKKETEKEVDEANLTSSIILMQQLQLNQPHILQYQQQLQQKRAQRERELEQERAEAELLASAQARAAREELTSRTNHPYSGNFAPTLPSMAMYPHGTKSRHGPLTNQMSYGGMNSDLGDLISPRTVEDDEADEDIANLLQNLIPEHLEDTALQEPEDLDKGNENARVFASLGNFSSNESMPVEKTKPKSGKLNSNAAEWYPPSLQSRTASTKEKNGLVTPTPALSQAGTPNPLWTSSAIPTFIGDGVVPFGRAPQPAPFDVWKASIPNMNDSRSNNTWAFQPNAGPSSLWPHVGPFTQGFST